MEIFIKIYVFIIGMIFGSFFSFIRTLTIPDFVEFGTFNIALTPSGRFTFSSDWLISIFIEPNKEGIEAFTHEREPI